MGSIMKIQRYDNFTFQELKNDEKNNMLTYLHIYTEVTYHRQFGNVPVLDVPLMGESIIIFVK